MPFSTLNHAITIFIYNNKELKIVLLDAVGSNPYAVQAGTEQEI